METIKAVIVVQLFTQVESAVSEFLRSMEKSGFAFVSRSMTTATGSCFIKFRTPATNRLAAGRSNP
jgi:hypothetical protein